MKRTSQLKRPLSEVIPTSPTAITDSALSLPPLKKRHNSKGGGLKKSTPAVRNNARVSFKGNYVARRCVQDICPLEKERKQTVSVIKVTANTQLVKTNGKGVLVASKTDFFVLNFSKMSKDAFIDALARTPEERAWIYIHEKGVVQVTFGEIAKVEAKAEDIMLGTLKISASMKGDARIEAQKVGTRIRPETKLAHCVQLDFGEKSRDSYRYLWVDESIFEEEAAVVPCSPVNDAVAQENVKEEKEVEEVVDDEEMREAAKTLVDIYSMC